MNSHESRRHLEAALAYLDALDAQDLDALSALWEQAETDAELERIFGEISQGVLEEEGLRPKWGEYRQAVLGALAKHVPSAFAPAPLQPLTVGDIAARIAANDSLLRQLSPADREANARLMQDATALPPERGMKELLELTTRLPVTASSRYWREFQQVAVLASMSRGQTAARAAAREAGKELPRSGKSANKRKPDEKRGNGNEPR
jgi:hypothetical protein